MQLLGVNKTNSNQEVIFPHPSVAREPSVKLRRQAQTVRWELWCPHRTPLTGGGVGAFKGCVLARRGRGTRSDSSLLRGSLGFVFMPVCSHRWESH